MMGDTFSPFTSTGSASSFEAAGYGRRLRNFSPSHAHINSALQSAGRTLVKRARFLVENNAYAGNAVDVWAAWVIGDGIRPRFPVKDREKRKKLKKLWNKWVKKADAECQTNFYGLQEKIVRETYISGECFVRLRTRRPEDMPKNVPLQLQVMPSEMLDIFYNDALEGGNIIRMGIEFDVIGRRVAYHFWRNHPDDYRMKTPSGSERVRVRASEVLHVFDSRQAGQIRGVSRFARAIVKLFSGDIYDDAEMERKKTAALYAGFVTQNGERSPIDEDDDGDDDDDDGVIPIEPGAMLALRDGEDVRFSAPADVGGSYEPFQYRITLQVSVALGIPYAYLTGDTTKGNFSNVRTEIVNFRRRVSQFQQNVIIPQGCERIAERWLDVAEATGLLEAGDEARDEDWLPPKMEWVDPRVDVDTAIKEMRAGFATRGQIIATKGYDREDIDDERELENEEADQRGLIYDTDPRRVSSVGMSNAVPTGSGYADPGDKVPGRKPARKPASQQKRTTR